MLLSGLPLTVVIMAIGFGLIGIVAAILLYAIIRRYPMGSREMIRIWEAIREGSRAYMNKQIRTIMLFTLGLAIVIAIMIYTIYTAAMNVEPGIAAREAFLTGLSTLIGGGERVECFVVEPHAAIASMRREKIVLNMVSRESEEARRASVDLVSEKPNTLIRLLNLVSRGQETLTASIEGEGAIPVKELPSFLKMPRRIDWEAIKRAYDVRPRNYEELVEVRGIGPSTLRALALISALIYGVRIDWRDPVKFSFAVGGKDGVPYPVSRRTYDEAISFMQQVLEGAEIEAEEKKQALRRLLQLERLLYG